MDKSWILCDRLSPAYDEGVERFLDFAQIYYPNTDIIPCPCKKCTNFSRHLIKDVRFHLFDKGFDPKYTVWTFHGEKHPKPDSSRPNTSLPPDYYETQDMLHGAFTNVEQEPEALQSLLEECEKPLYEGSKYNALSGLLKFQHLKGQYGWSDGSFDALLCVLKDILPSDNRIPKSIYEAKKLLKGVGLEYEKIHACENDCCLFWDENKDASRCPHCDTSRWKKNTTKVPSKVMWYFPPIPRFKRMFSSAEIARDLTSHAQGRVNNGKLTHPRDSPSWKHIDDTWKEFGKEHRNLRLALSADGICPHKSLSSTYSCWPVILVTYNLPSYLCMTRKFMMLTLLISGPNQPGNNIDVYLAPLIKDLKLLWETGVQTYDAYRKEYFNLRACLLWTINDFPAYGNLSGCVTKGYYACPICAENVCSQYLKNSKKVCYLGHRRFLPVGHSFRKRRREFNNEQEEGQIPHARSGEEIYNLLEGFETKWGKTPTKKKSEIKTLKKQKAKKKKENIDETPKRKKAKKKKQSNDETPKEKKTKKKKESIDERCKLWHKKSIFFELEYWKKLLVRNQLDVMHIEKNVLESVCGTMLNVSGKTKDGVNARLDLELLGIKPDMHGQPRGSRTYYPPGCYTLNAAEKKQFYETLSNLKVPAGYCSNFKNIVSDDGSKMSGLKSNDCHVLMQQLLPFAIKGVLPVHVRKTILSLCHFFNELCSKVVVVTKLSNLQKNIVLTLCSLEKHFPPSFFDVMIHLMVHLVKEVRLCGPVHFRWMYPFERYMKTLKGYVRNHYRPEGCIAECYVAEEALEFCSDYMKNMGSIGNPHAGIDERIRTGKPLSKGTIESADPKLLNEAHLYVLRNSSGVEPYIEQHMLELKKDNPRAARKGTWLHNQHSRTFCNWLKTEVGKRIKNGEEICDNVRWLAKGPNFAVKKYSGFGINEYQFHTTSWDESKTTQCSGVSLVAHAMQIASAKDPNPVYGAVTYYGRIKEIWELDYRMFTVPVFMCDWADVRGIETDSFGFTVVNLSRLGHQTERFILASQARQVFYVQDQENANLSVVGFTPHKMYKYKPTDEVDDTLEFDATVHPRQQTLVDLEEDFMCTRPDGEGIFA